MLYDVLSCLYGYYQSNIFELDIPKIADIAELSEEEVILELDNLQSKGDIKITDNIIILNNISAKNDKKFNDLWAPVETILWEKNTILKLDV